MSISISNTNAASSESPVQNVPTAPPPAANETSVPTDTVTLSHSGPMHALVQSGQGVPAIANALGVSVDSVDNLLGLAVTATAAMATTSATATI
jgi:hypothetical protein